MKKKAVSILLSASMLAAMISGCGSEQAEAPTDGTGDAAAVQEEAEAPSADAEAETEAPAADAEATDAAAEAVTLSGRSGIRILRLTGTH